MCLGVGVVGGQGDSVVMRALKADSSNYYNYSSVMDEIVHKSFFERCVLALVISNTRTIREDSGYWEGADGC